MDLLCYVLTGRPTLLFPFAPFIGLMILCGCTAHLRSLWPKRCLFCGRQAVIAAVTTLGGRPNYRSKPQNWCAACGQYDAPEEGKPWWLDEDLADTNEFLLPESDANT
jgi:hypothetical protein